MHKCSALRFLAFAVLMAAVALLTACSGPRELRAPHGYTAAGLAFSPDGSEVAVVYNSDFRGILLELREWPSLKRRWQAKMEGEIGHPMPVTFSPDGATLAVAFRDRVFLYRSEGEELGSFSLEETITVVGLSFTPKGDLAVLVSWEGQTGLEELYLERYDLDGTPLAEPRHLVSEPELWWRPFSPGGRFLVYVDRYDTLGWMDLVTGEAKEWNLRQTLGATERGALRRAIWPVAVHPQGKEVALGLHVREAGLLMFVRFDPATGTVIEELLPAERDDDFISDLVYSPKGDLLASQAVHSGFKETQVSLYPLSDGELQVLCRDEPGKCGGRLVAFSPDAGSLVAVRGERILFWKIP